MDVTVIVIVFTLSLVKTGLSQKLLKKENKDGVLGEGIRIISTPSKRDLYSDLRPSAIRLQIRSDYTQ